MAMIHFDGFDSYSNNADLSQVYNTSSSAFDTTNGRFGGGAVYSSYYGAKVAYILPAPKTEVWIGFALKSTDASRNSVFFAIQNGSNPELAISMTNNNGMNVFRGASSFLGNFSQSFSTSSYYWIEIHYKMDSSAGIIEVWVNGVQKINLTGVNTSQSGATTFSNVTVLGSTGADTLSGAYVDDFYILDLTGSYNNTRLGDCKVESLVPASDAGPNDGTPSSGTDHFAMVHEVRNDGGTTYLTIANVSGQEELFTTTSLAGSPTTIFAAKVISVVEKTDAGAVFGQNVISSYGTPQLGASFPVLYGAYGWIEAIYEVDPDSSTPWNVAGINQAKIGFEIT